MVARNSRVRLYVVYVCVRVIAQAVCHLVVVHASWKTPDSLATGGGKRRSTSHAVTVLYS